MDGMMPKVNYGNREDFADGSFVVAANQGLQKPACSKIGSARFNQAAERRGEGKS